MKKQNKYKIVVELPFGVFRTEKDAALMKKRVKAKAKNIVFTASNKTRGGYAFKGRLSYVKSISAPANTVKQVIQSRSPGAKVSVTRA